MNNTVATEYFSISTVEELLRLCELLRLHYGFSDYAVNGSGTSELEKDGTFRYKLELICRPLKPLQRKPVLEVIAKGKRSI